jgi:hypothetical protein
LRLQRHPCKHSRDKKQFPHPDFRLNKDANVSAGFIHPARMPTKKGILSTNGIPHGTGKVPHGLFGMHKNKREVVRQNNLFPVPSCKIAFFVKDTGFAGEHFLFYNPICFLVKN